MNTNRAQYITQKLQEQYGGYPHPHPYGHPGFDGHPTMQPGHPYQMHHYQAAAPAHHPMSHAGMDHEDAPEKTKSGGKVKSFLAGTAVGAAGVIAAAHKLHSMATAPGA